MGATRPPADAGGDLLRVGAVARALGVSPVTVWRWANRAVRPLPSVRVGCELRYRWEEVKEWNETWNETMTP
jgi:predicted DNA-binding transcriptional regulator AlpA